MWRRRRERETKGRGEGEDGDGRECCYVRFVVVRGGGGDCSAVCVWETVCVCVGAGGSVCVSVRLCVYVAFLGSFTPVIFIPFLPVSRCPVAEIYTWKHFY